MAPSPEDVMRSVENDYNVTCRLTTNETVNSVEPPVEFVVEDVSPDVAQDIAKYVSVRGYQAYLGEITDSQTGNIPVAKTSNT